MAFVLSCWLALSLCEEIGITKLQSENEAYAGLLHGHVSGFVGRLRQLPPDRWDWQIDIAAPSARTLAEHTWQWLVCDRQHILESDLNLHLDVPTPPEDPQARQKWTHGRQ